MEISNYGVSNVEFVGWIDEFICLFFCLFEYIFGRNGRFYSFYRGGIYCIYFMFGFSCFVYCVY